MVPACRSACCEQAQEGECSEKPVLKHVVWPLPLISTMCVSEIVYTLEEDLGLTSNRSKEAESAFRY